MIRILKIQAQNFLSLGSVSLDIGNRGLTIIDGINEDSLNFDNNGSGKSSIVEAIVYSLYGKTIRGISDDTLINREIGKKLEVTIELEVDDKEYTIIRRRKYSGKNNIELWIEGKDTTPYSEKELNLEIERILGMSYKVFTSSIVFSDKSVKFAVSTNSELKDIFEDILNLDFLTECYGIAKNRINLSENKVQMLQAKKLDIETNLKSLEEFQEKALEEYHREIKNRDNSIEELKSVIEETKNSIEEVKDEIKLEEDNLSIQKNKLTELQSQLQQTTPVFTEEFDDNKYLILIKETRDKISKLEEERTSRSLEITRIMNKIFSWKSERKELLENLGSLPKVGDICKYCGNKITEKNLKGNHNMEAMIKELDSKIDEEDHNIRYKQDKLKKEVDNLLEASYKELSRHKEDKKKAYTEFLERKEQFI